MPTRARNITCWRCSRIRPGASIWATCATTRWATWSRATSARWVSRCCIRWDGTHSACRRKTPRWPNKVHPKDWTYENIATMKAQLKSMGLSLDWAREFATCDPSYYKHQQKMFLDFLKAGLVERKQSKVNWDPVDQTVLANEQVIDGRGWRSGALVEQRELTQWFFKISDYSQDLLDSIDTLERWPDKVRLMQRNWIGRSEGLLVRFALDPKTTPNAESELEIFTTRPDTLFGAKFMALAPDHPLAQAAAKKNPKLAEFIAEAKRIGTAQEAIEKAEKLGFDTGIKAIHPFDPSWKLPVYVANFILMDYGTGAIFGCPAHDQRDLDFVNKYGLGNVPVVCPEGQDPKTFVITDTAYDGDGRMINSRFLDGMTIEQAKEEVAKRLETETRGNRPVAMRQINFRLRDWGISRQRYWGCPIPVIHCETAASCRCRTRICRFGCPTTSPSTSRAIRSITIRPGRKSPARYAAGRRGAKPTPWIRSWIRPGISRASPIRGARTAPTDPQDGERMDAGRSIYRRHRARDPASALQPLLHPRDAGDRPCRHEGAVRRPVHAGHGRARDLPQGRRRIRDAGRSEDRNRRRQARREARSDRRAGGNRRDREDVEVEAQHGRSRRHHRIVRRRYRALVHAVGFAARARRDLDRGRRARRLAFRAAAVAAGQRDRARSARARRREKPAQFSGAALDVRKAAHRALVESVGRHRQAALQPLRRAYLRMRQRDQRRHRRGRFAGQGDAAISPSR